MRDEEYRISVPSSSQIQRYFSTNDKVRSRVPRIEHAHPCLFDPFREDGQSFSYLTAHPPLSTSSLSENPLQEISNLRWISASNRHLYRISPMVNRDSPANFLFNFNPFSKIAPLPGETLMVHHGAAFPPSREGKWAARVESSFESPSHENKRARAPCDSFTPSSLILLNFRAIPSSATCNESSLSKKAQDRSTTFLSFQRAPVSGETIPPRLNSST